MEQPRAELRLLPGEYGAVPDWWWVDPRTTRVIQRANLDNPQRAPRLPDTPLPDGNRWWRRNVPDLSKISREQLRKLQRQRLAPAFVTGQVATASGTGVTTLTATLPSNVTAGNCVLAVVASTGSTILPGTPTDGLGNLYANAQASNNTGNCRIQIYFANNAVGGACSVTVTSTSTTYTVAVFEYSGVGSIAGNRTIADAVFANNANSTGPSNTLTPQQSGSLLVSAITDATGGLTWTQGGTLANRRASVTTTFDLAMADVVLSSIAAATAAWTNGGTTTQWSDASVILRPSGTQATAQRTATNAASGTSWATGSFSPKQGEVILGYGMTASTSVTGSSATDANSNTYSKVGDANNASGGDLTAWLCNGSAGATSGAFTLTGAGGSATAQVGTLCLPGIIPNAALVDQVKVLTGSGTNVSVTTDNPTTVPNGIAILIVGSVSSMSSFAPGGSDTLYNSTLGGAESVAISGRVLGATGTVTMTATLGASIQWCAILVTLKTDGVSLVQSNSSSANSTTTANTLTFNSAPGNNLIACVDAAGSITAPSGGITDNRSNAWSRAENALNSTNCNQAQYGTASIAGGKLTTTFTPSATGKISLIVLEISGGATDTWFDVGTVATGNGQTVSLTNPTPNFLFRIVVAAAGDGGTGRAYTSASPFAQPQAALTTNANLAVGICTVFEPSVVPTGTSTTLAIPGGVNVQYAGTEAAWKIANSPNYYQKAISDPATATDALARQGQFARSVTDPVTATDTLSRHAAFARTVNDPAAAADTLSRLAAYHRAIADPAATVDVLTRLAAYHRAVSDPAAAADSLTRHATFARVIHETAKAIDTATRHHPRPDRRGHAVLDLRAAANATLDLRAAANATLDLLPG